MLSSLRRHALGTCAAFVAALFAAPTVALADAAPPAKQPANGSTAPNAADAAKQAAKPEQSKPSNPNDKGNASDKRAPGSAMPTQDVSGNEPAIPPPVEWSFTGMFGRYDVAQLQRGYQIYKEVCSNCHSMKLVAFHNLTDLGYTPEQIKALAETYQIEDGPNDKGEMYKRPGRPSDFFPSPFPNVEAAKAAYGNAPPDMSTLAKARGWERGFPQFIFDFFTQAEEAEGPTYIHAILNGYTKPDDPKYNLYMTNHRIAMPKPLSDGQVQYSDGSPQTLDQYSKDVSAFLMWASEPKLQARKAMGIRVLIFLVTFSTLLFFVKKRIWARVGGDVVVGAPKTAGASGRPYAPGSAASK